MVVTTSNKNWVEELAAAIKHQTKHDCMLGNTVVTDTDHSSSSKAAVPKMEKAMRKILKTISPKWSGNAYA